MRSKRYVSYESRLDVARRARRVDQKISTLDFLWIPAVLVFGVGDVVTTRLALRLGAVEGNDLVRFLVEDMEGGLLVFVMLKAAILLALLFLSFATLDRFRWMVPSILCCVGAYLLMENMLVILTLL